MFIVDPIAFKISEQLLLAAFLGGLIGIERWFRRKPAGLRTYALVSLGACLFVSISMNTFHGSQNANVDPSRVLSQIVVGIGFLGAGIIFHKENLVQGLTTAAGLWVTAAIGASVGMGFYSIAVVATLITLLIFFGLFFFERSLPRNQD